MKKASQLKCFCDICKSARLPKFSEREAHVFVGMNKANDWRELDEFENDLVYKIVTHWDVGYTKDARYYVYRNGRGQAIAWYDSINECGYK